MSSVGDVICGGANMFEKIQFLWDSDFSLLENFVLWLNCFGACIAAVVNHRASKHAPTQSLRRVFFIISGFAWFYFAGYLALLVFEPPYLEWASLYRGVSVFVWGAVWTAPALVNLRVMKRLNKYWEENRDEVE